MKKISIIAALFMVACVAKADINIHWTSNGGVSDSGSGWGANDRLIQLIWSATDPVANQGVWGAVNYLAAGEYLLFSATDNNFGIFSDPDTSPVYANGDVGGGPITTGYVFSRIFESSTITSGTLYYQSVAVGPALPTYNSLDVNTIISYVSTTDPVIPPTSTLVAVPEPSTVGLLLVGVGLVAARRFRRA